MQFLVEIPDHLAHEAQARDFVPDRHRAELLAHDLAGTAEAHTGAAWSSVTPALPPARPDKQSLAALFEAMAAHSDEIPSLPDEAFTRESFYRDHH